MATHSSVLAWRIPGTGESGGLPSMGSHRVGHDWSDLAAAAATFTIVCRADTSLCTIGDNFWSFLLCTLSGVVFFFQFIYFLLKYNCFTEFSCFMFWLFGSKECGILAPRPGIEPAPPALEGEVLATGQPGRLPESILCFIKGKWTSLTISWS